MVSRREGNYLMKIQEDIENQHFPQEHREYLGMSQIGNPCKRKLWYDFRWCYDSAISSRIKRLFARGEYEETVIQMELDNLKLNYTDQVPCTGPNKHIKGTADAVLYYNHKIDLYHKTVLEIKTANDKNWKQFQKVGVKAKSPLYYAQAQLYCHALDIKECLFVITNKNTEDRLYEVIDYCKEEAEHLLRIAEDVIFAQFPPPKIGDATYFECKYCNAAEICHYGETINRNCRTCQRLVITENNFICGMTSHKLSKDEQIAGCNSYLRIEI